MAACPINLLGGPGSITPEMLDFISADSWTAVKSTLQSAVANFSGKLFALPAGDRAHGDRRANSAARSFSLDNDRNAEPNAFVARSPAPDAFPPEREVNELYAEVGVPLLGLPFVNRLDLELAGRYSDYDRFGNTSNPKVGPEMAPDRSPAAARIVGHRLSRADLRRSLRRPDARLRDDRRSCAGANFATLPGCGGRQAPANTTGTFVLSGGNPDLAPEDADNLTVGAVFTPELRRRGCR